MNAPLLQDKAILIKMLSKIIDFNDTMLCHIMLVYLTLEPCREKKSLLGLRRLCPAAKKSLVAMFDMTNS